MNINLSTPEPPFVFQISQSSNIGQKCFFIQNLQMDFSFQEKKTVCKSVKCFKSYSNSRDTGEFMRFGHLVFVAGHLIFGHTLLDFFGVIR